jgi:hypothetical protein
MTTETVQTSIVITDANKEEMESLYGKIPPENELLEVPKTHSLEEARLRMPEERSLGIYKEAEEEALNEISQQNI